MRTALVSQRPGRVERGVHTQARHRRATQRKLDEILLAIPGTDNALVTLEHASDDELRATGHQHGRNHKPEFAAA